MTDPENKPEPVTSVGTGLDDDLRAAQARVAREQAEERAATVRAARRVVWSASRRALVIAAIVAICALGLLGFYVVKRPSYVDEPGPVCTVPATFAAGEKARANAAAIEAFVADAELPVIGVAWRDEAAWLRRKALACAATFAAMHDVDPYSLSGDVDAQAAAWLASNDRESARSGAQVILAALAKRPPQWPTDTLVARLEQAVEKSGRDEAANALVLDLVEAAQERPTTERDAILAAVPRAYPRDHRARLFEEARFRADAGAKALAWVPGEDMDLVVSWFIDAYEQNESYRTYKSNAPVRYMLKMNDVTRFDAPRDAARVAGVLARLHPTQLAAAIDKTAYILTVGADGVERWQADVPLQRAPRAFLELESIVAPLLSADQRCARAKARHRGTGMRPFESDPISELFALEACRASPLD